MALDLLLDPFSGISGDMFLGLLVDLGVEAGAIEGELASLPLPSFALRPAAVHRGGLAATRVAVELPAEPQPHRGLREIRAILEGGGLTSGLREGALRLFARLAAAEAKVHGVPVDRVHFHEVGALDTVVDLCGALVGLDRLGVANLWTTPPALGSGTVACAHGRLPVPPPAVAELLTGRPCRAGGGEGELTTPTGAVLLAELARPWPAERTYTAERVGYGAGGRDREEGPNVLRGTLIRTAAGGGTALELTVGLDDASGEVAAHALERALEAGALDAWITQVIMKKGRPGLQLSALVEEGNLPAVERALLTETPTLGVRRHRVERTRLPRRVERVDTPLGPLLCKVRELPGGGVERYPEYEDLRRLAAAAGLSLPAALARLSGLR